jgi:hypothetical protein
MHTDPAFVQTVRLLSAARGVDNAIPISRLAHELNRGAVGGDK